jgi:hypothetical protein
MGKSNELILNGKILAACLHVKRIFSAQDSFSGNNGVSCSRFLSPLPNPQASPTQKKSAHLQTHEAIPILFRQTHGQFDAVQLQFLELGFQFVKKPVF